MYKVSILVNCYNSETFLQETLDSIFNQTYRNFEVIFWDNCSTDNSATIAQKFDSRLKYFKAKQTSPLYEARKQALYKISGELVTFLDCDDTWQPDNLEKKVSLFDNEKVGIVFSDVTYFNSEGNIMRLYNKRPYYTGHCFEKLLSDYFLCLPTVIIRKKALDDLKYTFDGRFNMIGDADLFRRIAMHWELAFVNQSLANYRIHTGALSHKNPDQFMEETYHMIKTYETEYPEIMHRYSAQVTNLLQQFIFLKFKRYWKENNSLMAKNTIKEIKPISKQYVVTLFYYLLPFKALDYLMKFRRLLKVVRIKINTCLNHFAK